MSGNNYLYFSPEEFASNAYFQNWVLQDDRMTNLFWEKWLIDNPEKKIDVDLARELIHQLKFKDYKASEKDFKEVWGNLKTNQTGEFVFAKLSRKKWYVAAVAASVVLFISISVFFNKSNDEQVLKPVVVNNNIKIGVKKATLTLGDGSNIILEKGQDYKTKNVTSNGEELVYNANVVSGKEIVYNYLTIPRGGQFFIKLSDGTQVWLNSESQLKYPKSFIDGETRQVELVYGEAYFDVSPSSEHKGSKFIVYNQSQEVEVLGTAFNIKAYKDEVTIYTTLVEGKVAINTLNKSQLLVPNQQSKVDKKGGIIVLEVDIYNETSWREGVFSFKRKSLKDIMTVLSRWYDMDVSFVDENLGDIGFTGVLDQDQNIEEILLIIKSFGVINTYEINDKTVVIK